MQIILLGTKGGPAVSATRCGPGQVVRHGDRTVLIDAGQGIPRQLVHAGVDPAEITDILITHHHSDHNVSVGAVLMAAWAHGRSAPITVMGPEPISELVAHSLEANRYDIDLRIRDEGRVDLRNIVTVRELGRKTDDVTLGSLRLRSALVEHPPVYPALAYRLDSDDGTSVVVSGDTAPSEALVRLAHSADVLIHEVIDLGLLGTAGRRRSNADHEKMLAHHRRSHTDVHDLGRIAESAAVQMLVLSHKVPADRFDESDWRRPIERDFHGEVVLGQDLMHIPVPPPQKARSESNS